MLKIPSSSHHHCLLALLSACALVPALHGQSSEADLRARLMDKPLYLRGGWRDDSLHFDSTGRLKSSSNPISFTLSGFELQTLHLKHDRLLLEGRRVGLELGEGKQLRIPLNVGRLNDPKDESVKIDIAANSSGDYGAALDAVFANGLAELAPSLPAYWQTYAAKNFVQADSSATPTAGAAHDVTPQDGGSPDTKPERIGGDVKPPKVLHMEEPGFNDAARRLNYGGSVLINLWLSPDGIPSHLSVVKAAGLGLDERALEVVQKYTFAPATRNGTPVLVELRIDVNFQIFQN